MILFMSKKKFNALVDNRLAKQFDLLQIGLHTVQDLSFADRQNYHRIDLLYKHLKLREREVLVKEL